MTKRQVVIDALQCNHPAYVPWSLHAPAPLVERARAALGLPAGADVCGDHIAFASCKLGNLEPIDSTHAVDPYGVKWRQTPGHGMGMPVETPLAEPTLAGYEMPDADDDRWYEGLGEKFAAMGDRFKLLLVRFSLFERAYLLRGMENLMIDMIERPEFVEELLDAISAGNLAQIRRAAELGVDAVHFCDDYGAQHGLLIGLPMWRRFIKPRLTRQCSAVREAGLYVSQHSCGNVQDLFDDFVEVGVQLYNPFQPEVMDVPALMKRYHGRLAFFGGLSDQQTLPKGTAEEVRNETLALIEAGKGGGYVLAPSGSINADVPLDNFLAMLAALKSQPGAN